MDNDDCAIREIELGEGCKLRIKEFTLLQDEAGAVVWDAGLVLSYYLAYQQAKGNSLVAGRTCLELGSGTGVVGLSAARLGAAQVHVTDLPHLVPYLRENIQLNGLGATCGALALEWGNQEHLAQARKTVLLRPPDVLLASDVVYTPAARAGLFATLVATMTPSARGAVQEGSSRGGGDEGRAPAAAVEGDGDGGSAGGSIALLCYERRPGVEELPELCSKHGLLAREVPHRELHPDWVSTDIHLLQLRLQSSPRAAATAPLHS